MNIASLQPRFGAFVFRANQADTNQKTPYFSAEFADQDYFTHPVDRAGEVFVAERRATGRKAYESLQFRTDAACDDTEVAACTDLLRQENAFDAFNPTLMAELNTPGMQNHLRESLAEKLPLILDTIARHWRAHLAKSPDQAAWYQFNRPVQTVPTDLLLTRAFFRDPKMSAIPREQLMGMMLDATGIGADAQPTFGPPKADGTPFALRLGIRRPDKKHD